MAPDDPPAPLVEHPDVGQQHAILDLAPEIFDAPSGVNRADHHLVEDSGVADLQLDGVDARAAGSRPAIRRG